MTPPIFHLVYVSRAAEDISYTDVQDILKVSRQHNVIAGISGMLIFREDYFLQLLEGSEAEVKSVLGKIMMDDRNHSLRVLIEAEGPEPLCKGWSMAFLDGDISSNETRELVEFFDTCIKPGANNRNLILPLLRKFRESAPSISL